MRQQERKGVKEMRGEEKSWWEIEEERKKRRQGRTEGGEDKGRRRREAQICRHQVEGRKEEGRKTGVHGDSSTLRSPPQALTMLTCLTSLTSLTSCSAQLQSEGGRLINSAPPVHMNKASAEQTGSDTRRLQRSVGGATSRG